MINIPGNRPIRPPTENNRVQQKEQVKSTGESANTKPADTPVEVERRRNPDRRRKQSSTNIELRSRRDRRRGRRIDIDV